MKKVFFFAFLLFISHQLLAQGCVAIRTNGGYCSMQHKDTTKWSLSINSRYFKSYKHFVGTEEQKQRVEQGSEVINHVSSTDFSITKKLKNDWSLSINIPVSSNQRSSLYEHDGKTRHSTSSFGVGDIRFSISKWLMPSYKKFNTQIGLGIKLPTGDYKYQDYFFVNDTTNALGPVDQSIQLGDGGTGITLEINSYYTISHKLSLYGNFYYLSNPREQNGVSTARGRTVSATAVKYTTDVMSVPDQMMLRFGLNYNVKNYMFSLGYRREVLPASDLIGGNRGFRRPGYIVSIEPGLTYKTKNVSVYAFAPIAITRNRTESYADKLQTQITSVYRHGDAAFADYSVNIGTVINF